MPISKKSFILSFLLGSSSILYARGGFFPPLELIFIGVVGGLLFLILSSWLLSSFLKKLFKSKPKSIFISIITRSSVIFVILLSIPFINYLFKSYIYHPGFISIKTFKETTIPIQNAFVSFCKKNNRFLSGTNEIDRVLNPIGVRREISTFTYKNIDFSLEAGDFVNHEYPYAYYLHLSTNINTSYEMFFNKDCSLAKEKDYKGIYVGIFN